MAIWDTATLENDLARLELGTSNQDTDVPSSKSGTGVFIPLASRDPCWRQPPRRKAKARRPRQPRSSRAAPKEENVAQSGLTNSSQPSSPHMPASVGCSTPDCGSPRFTSNPTHHLCSSSHSGIGSSDRSSTLEGSWSPCGSPLRLTQLEGAMSASKSGSPIRVHRSSSSSSMHAGEQPTGLDLTRTTAVGRSLAGTCDDMYDGWEARLVGPSGEPVEEYPNTRYPERADEAHPTWPAPASSGCDPAAGSSATAYPGPGCGHTRYNFLPYPYSQAVAYPQGTPCRGGKAAGKSATAAPWGTPSSSSSGWVAQDPGAGEALQRAVVAMWWPVPCSGAPVGQYGQYFYPMGHQPVGYYPVYYGPQAAHHSNTSSSALRCT